MLPPFGRDHAHADALEALADEATYRRHRAALATPGTPHRARHEAVVADIERSYRALHAMGAV